MKKEKNGSFEKKIIYIIFSVIASIALWSYVAYVENPDVTVPINSIPITFIGEDVLTENDLVVTDISNSDIAFRISGKRNTITKINDGNVEITVDLAEIVSSSDSGPGVYQLEYDIKYPDNINSTSVTVESASANYIAVKVERLVTANVPVKGTYNGNVADGYQAKAIEFNVDEITISGPEDLVSEVECAWVNLNIYDDITKTIEQETSFTLLDSAGNEITSDNITMSQDTVIVRIPVLIVKDVALVVNFAETSVLGKSDYTFSISPASVTLSGEAEVLDDINQIVIGTIDLTSFASSMKESFPIPIPNEVNNLTGIATAEVAVTVPGLETKEVTTTNIQYKNAPDGYNTTITTHSVDVLLRGSESTLSKIEESNVRLVVDLSDLTNNSGVFSLEAKVYIDGYENVDPIGTYNVSVIVSG